MAGSGRKREKLRNIAQYILQSKKCKGQEAKNTGAGTGIKGYGKREVETPLSPPPPTFYLVINKVKSGSIKTPLENVRNQTLANLSHSFKVERLNNVRRLFCVKRFFFTLSTASES